MFLMFLIHESALDEIISKEKMSEVMKRLKNNKTSG